MLDAARSDGAESELAAFPVGDLGVQAGLVDPTGAPFGLWQAGSFSGFPATGEPGLPSWFELQTPDCKRSVAFYRALLGWQTTDAVDGDTTYTTIRPGAHGADFGGITDASSEPGTPETAHWVVYWRVGDMDAALRRATAAGGSVHAGPTASPYGILATAADPAGAEVRLHVPGTT